MTEVNPPAYLQVGTAEYTARHDRRMWGFVFEEGVAVLNAPNDLYVTEDSTPGMRVKVARGGALVQGDDVQDQGLYGCYNDGAVVLDVDASHATLDRIDVVVAHVYDTTEDAGQVGDTWALEVVKGTADANPTEPNIPDSSLKLAVVHVDAAVTSIVNADIDDARTTIQLAAGSANIGAKVTKESGSQSISSGSDHAVTWDTVKWDDEAALGGSGLFDPGQSTRLTAQRSGRYRISGCISADGYSGSSNSVVGSFRTKLQKNGATFYTQYTVAALGGSTAIAVTQFGCEIDMLVGDYIEVLAYISVSNGSVKSGADVAWVVIEKVR